MGDGRKRRGSGRAGTEEGGRRWRREKGREGGVIPLSAPPTLPPAPRTNARRYTVSSEELEARAPYVVVTGSPAAVSTIEFDPPMSAPSAQLLQRMPMGTSMKVRRGPCDERSGLPPSPPLPCHTPQPQYMLIYDEGPWWRDGANTFPLTGAVMATKMPGVADDEDAVGPLTCMDHGCVCGVPWGREGVGRTTSSCTRGSQRVYGSTPHVERTVRFSAHTHRLPGRVCCDAAKHRRGAFLSLPATTLTPPGVPSALPPPPALPPYATSCPAGTPSSNRRPCDTLMSP